MEGAGGVRAPSKEADEGSNDGAALVARRRFGAGARR